MLTAEELDLRRADIDTSPELAALLQRLAQRAGPVLARMPEVPSRKALLTADGGVCPSDGTRLTFDPWSPRAHRCPRCATEYRGERHDRAWAHYQHLWLSERAAHLAAVAAFAGREDAAGRANELLQAYRGYGEYPNRDNVLGPSRLFFSTYLESIWICNYLAAAMLLREAGCLEDETGQVVAAVADEAANIIGDFDEGLSNRQTWHNAALASIGVWFEDEELASRAVEGSGGIVTHLLHGFGEDGMWYEGDNYHLFALRGQLLGMWWARQAGVDLLADARLADRLTAALRAPTLTALPDFTFPARKDSRFGVSLAQPMYLELWEIGLARVGAGSEQGRQLWSWLAGLYETPAPAAQTFDSYLHEAGEPEPGPKRTRTDLSWWALLEMVPSLPADLPPWSPETVLVEGQGLAVLRGPARYASLECGRLGGGHGHPDRLNLIVHADGAYWLPDVGTGSYVARDLFWYRSTLAHNAPRLDGVSQPLGDAECENFDVDGDWAWARGRFGELSRTLVAGPHYLVDLVERSGAADRTLELPWHLGGDVEVHPPGTWVPADLEDEFVQKAERLVSEPSSARVLQARAADANMSIYLPADGELLRVLAPGAPGTSQPEFFYLLRAHGKGLRFATVLEPAKGAGRIQSVRLTASGLEIQTSGGVDSHSATADGWEIKTAGKSHRLAGARRTPPPFKPLIRQDRPLAVTGHALQVREPPALDGSLSGFDASEPLQLDHEDQYRRSEEPYAGAENFSASAAVNWDDRALYLGVEVIKPDVIARDPGAAPLLLDNEPDEIHSDGLQIYLKLPAEEQPAGFLVVPTIEGALHTRGIAGFAGAAEMVEGSWAQSETGYTVTLAIKPPGWGDLRPGDQVQFDLLVNEMQPERLRRAGQLVWSGGAGWVWLRGDRQDPSRFGTLELR